MASIVMLIGGALANALVFTGSSFLFHRLSADNNQLRLERKAETKFTELNEAMREYHEVFGHELPPLPREPVLSDFYTPKQ